ncbi:MAG TPA: hypothetical protein VMB50_09540 [Myxococcales bacterium]|nr:hypothetical protein [Myxococcales bacterium]
MKRLALACGLLTLAAPALAGELEVEIGGGGAYASAVAPALSVRAGWEFFRHLTVSARYLGLDQPPVQQYAGQQAEAEVAYQAWAAMAEANLHTAGNVQVGLGLALGLGQATFLYPPQMNVPEATGLERGTLSPCGQLSITARLVLPWRLFVAVEVGADVWSGLAVTYKTEPPQTGQLDNGFLTLLNVGWRPF